MSHPSLDASTLEIALELMARKSITPIDAGCQNYISEYLGQLGFETEHMDFEDTENIWSIRGNKSPYFVFAGHTDVVPPGNLELWDTPPFQPTIKDGYIYGRGAADMKGSIAAMLTATRNFVKDYPEHKGSIAFLITSDEEGPFINGTVRVIKELQKRQQAIDYAIVGEPSSSEQLGDVIKIGRRGSLSAQVIFKGTQGHVAYPHLANNALHSTCSFVNHLVSLEWDQGNEYFPATSLQVTKLESGDAGNVIPGEAKVNLNFRYSTEQNHQKLQQTVEALVKEYASDYDISWKLNGEPFLTESKTLINATAKSIKEICGIETSPETTGGTSDGRFIAKTGAEIVELGPINKTIHKINECVKVSDLDKLSRLYYSILKKILLE